MRKRLLLWTTLLMMLAGIGCAMIPFGRAMNPNAESRNNFTYIVKLSPLKAGEFRQIDVNGRPLFVLSPSAEQWKSIHQMDSLVGDPHMSEM